MKHPLLLSLTLAAVTLMVAPEAASRAMAQTASVDVRILAINDFHGYLRAPAGGIRVADPAERPKKS